ncbi:MAG: squalene/phytoene synthase family protein [Pseudoruegeria sp.]
MSVSACAGLVEKADPDRFLAAMAAPLPAREILFPLYAFNSEVARAPWVTQEAMIAEMRLQWWRDAIEEIEAGGDVRRHEVTAPLTKVLREKPDLCAVLDDLILARRWDIYRDAFENQTDFIRYLDQTSGTLMWASAHLIGADRSLEGHIRSIGQAHGLAQFFLAIPELERRGRIPLVDGRPAALRAMATDALKDFAMARKTSFGAATPALRAAWRSKAILTHVVQDPSAVADGLLGESEFHRRGRLLVKTVLGRW